MTEWVLVPREPTVGMLADGERAMECLGWERFTDRVWKAMIDAAPLPPNDTMTPDEARAGQRWAGMDGAIKRDEAEQERAHVAYLRGVAEGKRQAAAPQQVEPVAQIGWADEFGNLFPMGAWKPAQRTHHDSHKAAWRPVFLHPPAAEVQQAEPVWVRPDQLQKARQAPFLCRVSPTKDALDLAPLYLHPPAAEVQRLRDAAKKVIDAYAELYTCPEEIIDLRRALEGLDKP